MRKSEQTSESELITIAGQFAEFDQFIEFTAGWDIDFRQLGWGSLNATLSQVVGESWSLAKARFDRPAHQQGAAVPGMRTFAIYAFRDRYDLSPKAFINSERLVRVKQDLRSRPDNVPIVEIANHWGFWHMGQFARDYRRQFGELPSQTPGL